MVNHRSLISCEPPSHPTRMKNDHTCGTFSVRVRTLPPSAERDFQMLFNLPKASRMSSTKSSHFSTISRNCVCGGIRLLKKLAQSGYGSRVAHPIAPHLPPATSHLGFGGSTWAPRLAITQVEMTVRRADRRDGNAAGLHGILLPVVPADARDGPPPSDPAAGLPGRWCRWARSPEGVVVRRSSTAKRPRSSAGHSAPGCRASPPSCRPQFQRTSNSCDLLPLAGEAAQ